LAPHHIYLFLFIIATGTALVARRLQIPYTVALVAVGLAIGNLKLIQQPPLLTKDLLFSIFLPGLIFEAAFHMDFKSYWQNKLALHALAFPGVLAAMLVTAVLLTPIISVLVPSISFSFQDGLLFGALVSATDPIAVIGLFKSIGVPRRLSLLLEGESLLNDGTAVVLYSLLLAAATGNRLSLVEGMGSFLYIVSVGALVGCAVGFCISYIISKVNDPLIEITLTVIAAYGSFLWAEELQSSGIISTMITGMIAGNYAIKRGLKVKAIEAISTFWEYVAFALNSVVFLLVGLTVNLSSVLELWKPILIAYVAMTAARASIIFLVKLALHRTDEKFPTSWAIVLTWGGLRGSLGMVLALAMPLDFAPRTYLIPLTFGIVTLSILGQGLSMAPLLRYLNVTSSKRAATVGAKDAR
jgi:CPA1 family monovalent cation:H+ antiporter